MRYTASEVYTPTNHAENRNRKEATFETEETGLLPVALAGLTALGWTDEEVLIATAEVAEQATYYDDLAHRYPGDQGGSIYRITGHHGDYDVDIMPE